MKGASIPGLAELQRRDLRWYLPEYESDRAARLTTAAKAVRKNDLNRQQNYDRYWSLYSNLPLFGVTRRRYSQTQSLLARDRLALNVIRSCSDSFVAKLTNERPRVSCVTSGGDWDLQQRAEMLETFIDGMFYECDVHSTMALVALDMAVFGTGTVKIYADGEGEHEHICIERVLPGETSVDEEESYTGKPRTRQQTRYVDRLVAMGMWGQEDEEIAKRLANAPRESEDDMNGSLADNSITDTIRIDEAWHLPSFAGAEDGRHTIACGDICLFDEPYDKPYFPFVDLYRQRPTSGIWGVGLAEELQGIQFEINVLLNTIRKAMRMSGSLRWMVENNSQVNTQYISDLIGSIIRFTGMAPQAVTPPAVAPEVYQHLVFLYGKAFEITGISQLSATSMAPGFEESGKAKALRLDTESERFSVAFREYQKAFLEIARQIIALAREIADRNPQFKVKAVGRQKMMDVVKWADIHLEDEEFVLQMYPTNALSKDPSQRIQQITDWTNAGVIRPRTARRLNDGIPDLEEEDSYEFASYNLTMQMITQILKKGEYHPPEPFMNLDPTNEDNAIHLFQMAYLKARMSNVPEERLEMMRQWIQQALDMQKSAAPPPPPGPPPGPPPPGAAPPPGPPPHPPVPMAA